MKNGKDKYGPFSWREEACEDGLDEGAYHDAIMRHYLQMVDGHHIDPDSGRPHAAHIMACCAILLDGSDPRTAEEWINDNIERGE